MSQEENKEILRRKVIGAQTSVAQCRDALTMHPDNPYLRMAHKLAVERSAQLYERYLRKYKEHPIHVLVLAGGLQ